MNNIKDILTGQTQNHLCSIDNNLFIHKDMLASLNKLQKYAQDSGFKIQVISGFRSFERQTFLWNQKASGQRNVFDNKENLVDIKNLDTKELLHLILRWSAIPGTSRHHWGTDIDVIDSQVLPKDYKVSLTAKECLPDGIFGKFHQWLDKAIESNKSFGFFRPYNLDKGGVACEKWHLSYAPLSQQFFKHYSYDFFQEFINSTAFKNIELNELIKEHSKKSMKSILTT